MPLRLEVGPRDLAAGQATIVNRVSGAEKASVSLDGIGGEVARLVATEQDAMLAAARAERDAHIVEVTSVDDAAASGCRRLGEDLMEQARSGRRGDPSPRRCDGSMLAARRRHRAGQR